jgi:hypothetical protein
VCSTSRLTRWPSVGISIGGRRVPACVALLTIDFHEPVAPGSSVGCQWSLLGAVELALCEVGHLNGVGESVRTTLVCPCSANAWRICASAMRQRLVNRVQAGRCPDDVKNEDGLGSRMPLSTSLRAHLLSRRRLLLLLLLLVVVLVASTSGVIVPVVQIIDEAKAGVQVADRRVVEHDAICARRLLQQEVLMWRPKLRSAHDHGDDIEQADMIVLDNRVVVLLLVPGLLGVLLFVAMFGPPRAA